MHSRAMLAVGGVAVRRSHVPAPGAVSSARSPLAYLCRTSNDISARGPHHRLEVRDA
jgi:hypothetical protein